MLAKMNNKCIGLEFSQARTLRETELLETVSVLDFVMQEEAGMLNYLC